MSQNSGYPAQVGEAPKSDQPGTDIDPEVENTDPTDTELNNGDGSSANAGNVNTEARASENTNGDDSTSSDDENAEPVLDEHTGEPNVTLDDPSQVEKHDEAVEDTEQQVEGVTGAPNPPAHGTTPEASAESSDDEEVDDDPEDPLEEPVRADDESDEDYQARRRSWSAKKAARTRAENKAAENEGE